MIGDGCLLYYPKHRIYGIEITGNATEETDYYDKIARFIKNEFNLKSRIYVKHQPLGLALKLVVYNKKLAEFMLNCGITTNKTYTIKISDEFLTWKKSKFILRGIFETDGSLYFSKSKTKTDKPSYPRLEIKTASFCLAKQIMEILNKNGFKAHCHQNGSTKVVYLSGVNMLEKWVKEIGFNSNKNTSKYLLWKKLGYYIPKISLQNRLSLLNS